MKTTALRAAKPSAIPAAWRMRLKTGKKDGRQKHTVAIQATNGAKNKVALHQGARVHSPAIRPSVISSQGSMRINPDQTATWRMPGLRASSNRAVSTAQRVPTLTMAVRKMRGTDPVK